MKRILKSDIGSETIIHVTFLLLCMLPILVSFFLTTNGSFTEIRFTGARFFTGLQCVFKEMTGYKCPSCGMTRAFIYMSGLRFGDAWKMNRAGVLLYIFCFFQVIYRSIRIFKPKISIPKTLVGVQAGLLILTGIIDLFDFAIQFT